MGRNKIEWKQVSDTRVWRAVNARPHMGVVCPNSNSDTYHASVLLKTPEGYVAVSSDIFTTSSGHADAKAWAEAWFGNADDMFKPLS